jgi:hypothetical protein
LAASVEGRSSRPRRHRKSRSGVLKNELPTAITTNLWRGLGVQKLSAPSTVAGSIKHMVMGSDLDGAARSRFRIWETLSYSRMLSASVHARMRTYLADAHQRVKTSVVYDGDEFMYTAGHLLSENRTRDHLGASSSPIRADNHASNSVAIHAE